MKHLSFTLAFLLAACAPGLQPGHGLERSPVEGAATGRSAAGEASGRPRRGQDRPPTVEEERIIELLMDETEAVRGLRFIHPVPISIRDAEAIAAEIEEQVEEERIEQVARVYKAIGLLEPDLDVKELLVRVLGEQILGYFDPKERRLVIRDDIMRAILSGNAEPDAPAPEEAAIALVHELVHALQSQHLSLSENLLRDRDIDGENAFNALVEGDATLAMLDYMLRQNVPGWRLSELTTRPEQVRALAEKFDQLPITGTELENAPAVVRVPLISAYMDGMSFVARLHGQGGWRAVDRAHQQPPRSSEQVLHPELYRPGSRAANPPLPALDALAANGYALLDEETLGELEIGVYFGLGQERERAKSAAAGWEWDRLQVFGGEGLEYTVVWYSLWDNEPEAREAEQAALLAADALGKADGAARGVKRNKSAVLIWSRIPADLQPGLERSFAGWAARAGASGGGEEKAR